LATQFQPKTVAMIENYLNMDSKQSTEHDDFKEIVLETNEHDDFKAILKELLLLADTDRIINISIHIQ
jgi:hypothetical protein